MKSFSIRMILSSLLFAFLLVPIESSSRLSKKKAKQEKGPIVHTSQADMSFLLGSIMDIHMFAEEFEETLDDCAKSSEENATKYAGKYFVPQIFSYNRKGVLEGNDKFFDPTSKDLRNYLKNWIHSLKSGFLAFKRTPISISNYRLPLNSIEEDLMETCISIDSRISSKSSTFKEAKPEIETFWGRIGLFDYYYFSNNVYVPLSSQDVAEAVSNYQLNPNSSDENGKLIKTSKKSKNRTGILNAAEIIPLFMKKDMFRLRKTLESVPCHRAFIHSINLMTKSQLENMFRFTPIAILDDPEIFDVITDYSGFKDELIVSKLEKLYKLSASSIPLMINEAMIKTLPLNALYRTIAANNFNITIEELNMLIKYRNGFNLKQPFVSDHRTFRLFSAYDPLAMSLDVKLINCEKEISADLIESILAEYVRSEYEIRVISKNIARIFYDDYMRPLSDATEPRFKDLSAPLMKRLIEIFSDRIKLIEFVEKIEGYSKVAAMLCTPMNGFCRRFLRKMESQSPIKKINEITFKYPFDSTYNEEAILSFLFELFYLYEPESTVIYSDEFHEILKRLRDVKAYNIPCLESNRFSIQSIAAEWLDLAKTCTRHEFYNGRWTVNFIANLSAGIHPSESAALEEETKNEYQMIINAMPRSHPIYISLVGGVGKYDWIIPVVAYSTSVNAMISLRELRKLWERIDLRDEELIEQIWTDNEMMITIITHSESLNDKHISKLLSTELGRSMLLQNSELLLRLPSFATFTLENMKELNLNLDDRAPQIKTLNFMVAQAWLKEKEYLVNSPMRTLLLQSPKVFTNDFNIWQYYDLETILSRSNTNTLVKLESESQNSPGEIGSIISHKKMPLSEILSVIARSLVLCETQIATCVLLHKFVEFEVSEHIRRLSGTIALNRNHSIPYLSAEMEKATAKLREDIEKFIEVLNGDSISSFRDLAISLLSHGPVSNYSTSELDLIYAKIVERNNLICKLIENGPGSAKFKRIWCHRAKLLTLANPKLELKGDNADMIEAANSGSIPMCDALLQWILLNNKHLKRIRISIDLGKGAEIFDNLDHPQAEWFKIFFRFHS